MTVNKNVQDYIDENGIKYTDIAKKLYMTKHNFSRILKADDMKISQLLDISEVLEVSPTIFFNENTNESKKGQSDFDKIKEECKKRVEYEAFLNSYITEIIDNHYSAKIAIYDRGIDSLDIAQETKEELKHELISIAEKKKARFKDDYKEFSSQATKFVESAFTNDIEQLIEKCTKEVYKRIEEKGEECKK